jgi:hypothetical protein
MVCSLSTQTGPAVSAGLFYVRKNIAELTDNQDSIQQKIKTVIYSGIYRGFLTNIITSDIP